MGRILIFSMVILLSSLFAKGQEIKIVNDKEFYSALDTIRIKVINQRKITLSYVIAAEISIDGNWIEFDLDAIGEIPKVELFRKISGLKSVEHKLVLDKYINIFLKKRNTCNIRFELKYGPNIDSLASVYSKPVLVRKINSKS